MKWFRFSPVPSRPVPWRRAWEFPLDLRERSNPANEYRAGFPFGKALYHLTQTQARVVGEVMEIEIFFRDLRFVPRTIFIATHVWIVFRIHLNVFVPRSWWKFLDVDWHGHGPVYKTSFSPFVSTFSFADRCDVFAAHTAEILSIVAGTLLLVLAVISLVFYRNWKYEQELDSLLWKVDYKDIEINDTENGSTSSKISRVSGLFD